MSESLPDIVERLKKSIVQIKVGSGHGTGLVVENGLIVTNRHVIGNQKVITVLDVNGNEYEGAVIRSDANIDFGIIKVDLPDPVPATWNEDPVREGMTVIAIGHPLGFEYSVSKGIVSSAKRVVHNIEYIQTDVSINPGNSGGPLIDEEGEVLAITTWMRSDAQNIGFAIPISYIRNALEEIKPLLDKLDEAVYCNVCGYLNKEKSKYCDHCGVIMDRPEPEAEQPQKKPDKNEKIENDKEVPEVAAADSPPQEAEVEAETAPTETPDDAEADTKFCIHCGTKNPTIAKFCKKCGKQMG